MEQKNWKESFIALPKKLQYFLAAAGLSLVITLGLPSKSLAQNKKGDQQEQARDSIEKAKDFNEWQEIFALRSAFQQGKYGSQNVMGIFDGKFVGPNDHVDYGLRSYTTAYDYLTLGNNLLSLLINLGYTADDIKFVPTDKVPGTKSYQLGCIQMYSISEDKHWVDSVYSTKLGKQVPVEKRYLAKNSHLKIDSAWVDVDLAGISSKKNKDRILLFPQIEGSGHWKDANNYDMAYEWMEYIFDQYKDDFDIARHQFSKHTPDEVKQCILQRFDAKKYMQQYNLVERNIPYKIRNRDRTEILDLMSYPNGTIVTFGQYEMFRFFTDVYRRDLGTLSTNKNPIWHNAFQYDKDSEAHNGLTDRVILSYGAKNYIMPTLVPRVLPTFSQFEGVVMYSNGAERETHSNKEDIWIITLNGRMVDRNLFEYPAEKGLLPLNDDGTVDRIYKIYSRKDGKAYWAYIYCGKHAGVRGGKPGKSFVEQVDDFRQQYDLGDYRNFVEDVDFQINVKNKLPTFIQQLQNLVNKTPGVAGKTIPNVRISLHFPDPKHEDKEIVEIKTLKFSSDYTAVLQPDGLIIPWEIEEKEEIKEGGLKKIKNIILHVLGEKIYLQELETFLQSHRIASSEVQRFNKKYLKDKANANNDVEILPSTNEVYGKQVYNLTDVDDMKILVERVDQDLAGIEYQLPIAHEDVEWQKTKKVDPLEKRVENLEEDGETNTTEYKNTKEEYDKEQALLETLEQKVTKLENKKMSLLSLQQRYREVYIQNLQNKLSQAKEKRDFIQEQMDNLQKQLQSLNPSDASYPVIQQSIKNKEDELKENQDIQEHINQQILDQKALDDE